MEWHKSILHCTRKSKSNETQLVRREDYPPFQTLNGDAKTFKRIHTFSFPLHSMSEENEVQSRRGYASFEMKPTGKEESHGIREKHKKQLNSNSEAVQTADDREGIDIVLFPAHPSSADLSACKSSPDTSHVKDGEPKLESNAICRDTNAIETVIVAVESCISKRFAKVGALI